MFKRGGIYAVTMPHADSLEPEVCPCLVVSMAQYIAENRK